MASASGKQPQVARGWGAQRPTSRTRRGFSATEAAVQGIKDFIRGSKMQPGDPLPTEAVLCDELGFSRSSIREAIRILTTLDIVEVRHGYGTYVSQMSLQPLVDGLVFRAVLGAERSLDTLSNVVDAREALDLSVGIQLVGRLAEDDLSRLRALVAEMKSRDQVGESFAEQDRQFHQLLLANVENPLIRELSDAFWQVHMEVVPILELDKPQHMGQTVSAHEEIVDAIEGSDLQAYQESVRRHYSPLREALDHRG